MLYKLFRSSQRLNASNYSTKSSCLYIRISRKLAIKYGIYIYIYIYVALGIFYLKLVKSTGQFVVLNILCNKI